jgi:hypothetical protein
VVVWRIIVDELLTGLNTLIHTHYTVESQPTFLDLKELQTLFRRESVVEPISLRIK